MSHGVRSFVIAVVCAALLGRAAAQEAAPTRSLQNTASGTTTAAATVSVTFTSASIDRPLELSAYEGVHASIEASRPRWHAGGYSLVVASRYQGLCTTPCTLQLPPGKFTVGVDGEGVASYRTTVDIPSNGADVLLRVRSPVIRYVGHGLLWPGFVAALSGAIVLGVAAPKTERMTTALGQVVTSHGFARTPLIAGATTLSVGAALLAIGIPLAITNGGGSGADLHARSPMQPTAKLNIGPGNLGVSGSF